MTKIGKCISASLFSLALLTGGQLAANSEDVGIGKEGSGVTSNHCDATDAALSAMNSDSLFREPYVDVDEWRDEPVRHRYVHGGFKNTENRFSLYLPPQEQYEGRFYQYITPVPMNEHLSQGASGEQDKIGFSIASGAYFIETNGGGRKAMARDPTIGAYRANAAVAQYSRVIAMEMYDCERPYGYAFGGSGGAYRSIGGMENTEGVWDGAVPFVVGSPMAIPNGFTVRMYALRVLKSKLSAIADAVDVGTETDVEDLLTEAEYSTFQEVTKMGFPREAWYIHDELDLHGYASIFPGVLAADPTYFSEDFWNKPGYEGHNPPPSLRDALVEHGTRIEKLIFAEDAEQSELKAALLGDESRGLADDAWKSMLASSSPDVPLAIQLETVPDKDLMGAHLVVQSGNSADSRLLITRSAEDFVSVGSQNGEALAKLAVGDEVQINNRDYLASQTYHRHQVPEEGYPVYDQFRDEQGEPIYPQRPMLLAPRMVASAAGSVPDGDFRGKMIVLSNLHDTEAYPWQGDWYYRAARSHLGENVDDRLRLWYTDHAAHGDISDNPAPTHLVSYLGVLQQALRDLSAWVEKGVEPPATTNYSVVDGQIRLPEGADKRGGIQPVVKVQVNGGVRAEVEPGEPVQLSATIKVPEGTGKVVRAEWDFGGEARYPAAVDLADRHGETVRVDTTHSYDAPGTYFVTLRAASQRHGDTETPFTRIRNLARARVVVE